MMKETNIHSQVTSTIAGDDGEAVAKSEDNAKKKVPEKPNEGLEKPADAGWYVAVVRVNCETRIADSIRINLNHNHVWFDYWIPKVKVVYIEVRVVSGSMKGVEAYVQSYNGKKAVIGSEIKYISGATLTISRNLLEVIEES